MADPRRVLYFAENALSAIQGGGIVAYSVLKGLPAEQLLGFYLYRNITPVPEYADRFVYLGDWRTPRLIDTVNRLSRGWTVSWLHRMFTEDFIREDFAFVQQQAAQRQFTPEVVYFSGLSYRTLRLAVMAAEHYDVPMLLLHMDDWMEVERREAGPRWGASWYRRIVHQMQRAAARSLASTSNSPRLAARLTSLTGYRHVTANNCCDDLLAHATPSLPPASNPVPVITYAGAMNQHLQGETVKILASAVTELNAEGTPVHLHIYTPWEFAPHANAVAVPNAVFYKGQVGRERLADIFLQSDFLVTTVTHRDCNIPLFRHSLSTKLSEYLCAGRPVISMGHADWHMHEYVQDHACGFSIALDEHYSRAAIKQQLRRILATDPAVLADIGRRNRELWSTAHDVNVMARTTRRAVRLPLETAVDTSAEIRRGALWIGGSGPGGAGSWLPSARLKAVARQLRDVFDHTHVDVIGEKAAAHPELDTVLAYCRDIGLQPDVVHPSACDPAAWEPAGARWSLASAQTSASGAIDAAPTVFDQVAALRGTAATGTAPTPVARAINQLSVRVNEHAASRPVVWVYGSAAIGLEVLTAIRAHGWLGDAVECGGFVSSPGHCRGEMLHGYRWVAIDQLPGTRADFVIVTSETSRLAIQEELSRAGLRERVIPLYGFAASQLEVGYERQPDQPGQHFAPGATASDYATRELLARSQPPALPGRISTPASSGTTKRASAA